MSVWGEEGEAWKGMVEREGEGVWVWCGVWRVRWRGGGVRGCSVCGGGVCVRAGWVAVRRGREPSGVEGRGRKGWWGGAASGREEG